MRIILEDAYGGEFEVQSGIACHAAGVFAVEAVGRCVFQAWGVGGTEGPHVNAKDVGIANQWLGLLDTRFYDAEAVGIEQQLFHQFYILIINIIRLVADIGEIKEIIGLMEDDMAQVGV